MSNFKQCFGGSVLMLGLSLAASAQETTSVATGDAPGKAEASKPFIGLQGSDLRIDGLPPVTFHAFLSQGFLYSSDYNYLGDSTRGEFRYTEMGLNASFNPFPRTRVSAQGFAFKVGDQGSYEPVVDYASVEYTFNDELGLRAGRVRRPQGIYNHIQDVDLARTWVLLPQGLYDARWRDFSCSRCC